MKCGKSALEINMISSRSNFYDNSWIYVIFLHHLSENCLLDATKLISFVMFWNDAKFHILLSKTIQKSQDVKFLPHPREKEIVIPWVNQTRSAYLAMEVGWWYTPPIYFYSCFNVRVKNTKACSKNKEPIIFIISDVTLHVCMLKLSLVKDERSSFLRSPGHFISFRIEPKTILDG